MTEVVLSIGSNFGKREENVANTLTWLRTLLDDFKCSVIYETPAAGKVSCPYMNAVCKGKFETNIDELNKILKEKEKTMGRDSQCRIKGYVPIDIDIVIANGKTFKEWDFNQKFFRIGYQEITSNK